MTSCNNKDVPPCIKKGWSTEIKIVEGEVKHYSPMDPSGHGSRESFFVDSVYFSYSDYMLSRENFYNNSCAKGGVICQNGQNVRISYKTMCQLGTGIVKIEILDK